MIHWKRQTTGTKQMSGFYGLGWTTGQINESGNYRTVLNVVMNTHLPKLTHWTLKTVNKNVNV